MPIHLTPTSGPSDHRHDVRSHTAPAGGGRMVTSESLRCGSRAGQVGDGMHRIHVAMNGLDHFEKRERRGTPWVNST